MTRLTRCYDNLNLPNRLHARLQDEVYNQLRQDIFVPDPAPWRQCLQATRASAVVLGPLFAVPATFALASVVGYGVAGGLKSHAFVGCVGLALLVGMRAAKPTDFLRASPGFAASFPELGVLGLLEYGALRGACYFGRRAQPVPQMLCMAAAVALRAGLLPLRLSIDFIRFGADLIGGVVAAGIGATVWMAYCRGTHNPQGSGAIFGDFGPCLRHQLAPSERGNVDALGFGLEYLEFLRGALQRSFVLSEITDMARVLEKDGEAYIALWQSAGPRKSLTVGGLLGDIDADISLNRALRDIKAFAYASPALSHQVKKAFRAFLQPDADTLLFARNATQQDRSKALSLARRRVAQTHPDKFYSIVGELDDYQQSQLTNLHAIANTIRDYMRDPVFGEALWQED